VVEICDRGQQFGQLINTQELSETQERIMCGGQQTSLSRRHLVDLHPALTAALRYLASAEPHPAITCEWTS